MIGLDLGYIPDEQKDHGNQKYCVLSAAATLNRELSTASCQRGAGTYHIGRSGAGAADNDGQ